MKINWRAVLGLPVLVEFADGSFGVRKMSHLGYKYLTLRTGRLEWQLTGSVNMNTGSRQEAEQALVCLYTKKKKKRTKVHDVNIKQLIAEQLLRQASCTPEDPLGQRSTVNWAHIPPMPKFVIPSCPQFIDDINEQCEKLAQAAMSAIHIQQGKIK